MILFDILQLQRKQFFRSVFFTQGIAIKILLGLMGLYLIATFSVLSFILPEILGQIDKSRPGYILFAKGLIYFIAFDILIRYFVQKLSTLDLQKFLLTPLKKTTIFHFSLCSSIFNIYNLLGWILLLPFGFRVIMPQLGTAVGINWLISIGMVPLISQYLAMYIKRVEVVSNFKGIFVLGFLVVMGFLDYMGFISIAGISEFIFSPVYNSTFSFPLYLGFTLGLYYLNYHLLQKNAHLDVWFAGDTTAAGIGRLDWLEQKGTTAAIIANELKLILRNKRTKTAIWLCVMILFYPIIFYSTDSYEGAGWSVFVGIFVSGIFMINYGQFMIGWESAGFDGLLSRNIPAHQYFQSKYIILVGSCIILYILSIPYFFIYEGKFLPHTASLLYNVGINSYFLLWASTYNKKRIDLGRSSMMNYQGTGVTQFLIAIPLLFGPYLIIAIPMALGYLNLAWIILGAISVLSIALHKFWMKGIAANYLERKYITAEGFRQKL